jgi:hypothetical protein
MAHVAISRDFIQRVQSKIEVMKNAELKALGEAPKTVLSPDSQPVLNAVWGEHLHLRNQIPARWKNDSNSVRLSFNTTSFTESVASDGTVERTPISCQFNVDAANNQRFDFPPNGYWHNTHLIPDADINHPDVKQAVQYGNAKAEIELRWSKVAQKVVQFFQSCKSMTEAVRLWPECKMYIDSKDIQRFETKVTKSGAKDSEAAKVLAGIDKDELVGAAVAARFTGVA